MSDLIQKTIAATAKHFNVTVTDILSKNKNQPQPLPRCRMIVILILEDVVPKGDIMKGMNITRHNYKYYLNNGREELADYFDMQSVKDAVLKEVAADLEAYGKEGKDNEK